MQGTRHVEGGGVVGVGGPARLEQAGHLEDEERVAVGAVGERLREGCRSMPDPEILDVFDHVYAEQTDELAEQKATYASYLSTFETEEAAR